MTKEEIRQRAIECGKIFDAMCKCKECETDEEFNTICHCEYNEVASVTYCAAVYGYEHGFAEGIEEGIHKFAQWCRTKGYGCYDWRMMVEQYENEQRGKIDEKI